MKGGDDYPVRLLSFQRGDRASDKQVKEGVNADFPLPKLSVSEGRPGIETQVKEGVNAAFPLPKSRVSEGHRASTPRLRGASSRLSPCLS